MVDLQLNRFRTVSRTTLRSHQLFSTTETIIIFVLRLSRKTKKIWKGMIHIQAYCTRRFAFSLCSTSYIYTKSISATYILL